VGVQQAERGKDVVTVVVELGRTRYGMWKTMTKVRSHTESLSNIITYLNPFLES
jgi:hypothetical protein